MTNYKSHSQKAFTLIEMLVVISLIGILAALAMVSFSSVQKQARDTARKSDLKQIGNAVPPLLAYQVAKQLKKYL